MNVQQPFRTRLPGWADLLTVGLAAVAAPWIAASIQSLRVFYSGFRPYNAQLGGIYFDNMGELIPLQPHQIHVWIAGLVCRYCGLGLLTFLVLLPLRKHPLYCWSGWAFFIGLWMIIFSTTEVALR
jgi:hypothetical protein